MMIKKGCNNYKIYNNNFLRYKLVFLLFSSDLLENCIIRIKGQVMEINTFGQLQICLIYSSKEKDIVKYPTKS